MIPPGTLPTAGVVGSSKTGLNGFELFKPNSDPPGIVTPYKLAVDKASLLLLKSFAVEALAIAIARLPGHASGLLLTIEQRRPCRSTIADHIRFGVNSPPLPVETTTPSCVWIVFTKDGCKAHLTSRPSSSARAGNAGAATKPKAIPTIALRSIVFLRKYS